MKKYRFIIVLSLIVALLAPRLASFDHQVNADDNGTENTIYLNLTRVGLIDEQPGVNIPEQFLEYGHVLTQVVGTPLPDASMISATTGATFVGWVIQSTTGGLQKITLMPGVANMILQAHFEGGEGYGQPPSSSEPTTSEPSTSETSISEPDPSNPDLGTGLYIRSVGSEDYHPAYQLEENGVFGDSSEIEYKLVNFTVDAGYAFYFGSPSNFGGLGDDTLPSYLSGKNDGIGYTLSSGGTNVSNDYLKVNGYDESGITGEGGYYYKFTNPTPLGSLEFKLAGTYDLYVVFWDNYGWAQIYVTPTT